MKYTNQLISSLQPSATLSIKAKTLELKKQGVDVVNLSAGEPDFSTPDFIKEAANQAMIAGHTRYTAVPGIPELRTALAEKFTKENNIPVEMEQVLVTNGGKQAIHEFMQVFLEPGDEVIIVAPYWVSYPDQVLIAGGVPKIIQASAENGYKIQPEELKAAISPKTRLLIINSPSNPTGAAYSKEEQASLAKVVADHDMMIMSDEVYEKITYSDFEFCSFAAAAPEIADRVITVNAFSKAYAMTGWRAGYAAGPAEVIKAMSKFQSQTTSNVGSITQHAALAALQGPQDFISEMNQVFWRRMQSALSIINDTPGIDVPVVPEGAFYLFIRIEDLIAADNSVKDSTSFCSYLLDEAQVAVVPGVAFGDDAAFRMSICVSDENLEEGLGRIKEAVSKL